MKKTHSAIAVNCLMVLLILGCQNPMDNSPSSLDETAASIPRAGPEATGNGKDASADSAFYFLPPLAATPSFGDVFDPTFEPTVEIGAMRGSEFVLLPNGIFTCQDGAGTKRIRADLEAEHYVVNWATRDFDLENGCIYRIRVLLGVVELGSIDVVVSARRSLKRNDPSAEGVQIKVGRTLPIKFRIEEGIRARLQTIAFSSWRDGNSEVYVMQGDGSDQTRLTYDIGDDNIVAWSPDKKSIVFGSDRDGDHEIYVMRADGTDLRQLTSNHAMDHLPAWSPDGNTIAFTSDRDGSWEIFVMGTDGSSQTRLTNDSATAMLSTWSPDSRRIAFVSNRDGNDEIYTMNRDGSDVQRLTFDPGIDSLIDWAPDGKFLAFSSNRDGDYEIYRMRIDGTDQIALTDNDVTDWSPHWSWDSSEIVFTSDISGTYDIYKISADGSTQTRITSDAAHNLAPDW